MKLLVANRTVEIPEGIDVKVRSLSSNNGGGRRRRRRR
jgi:hypothetical protein